MSRVAPLLLSTRRATIRLACRVAAVLEGGDLLVMTGGLGAGKTFFARALCRALGVPAGERVTSPTFTLVHEHRGRLPIRHVDAYRLRDASELRALGLTEQRDDGALLIVEWGEPYVAELGGDALILAISVSTTGSRSATLSSTGPRSALLERACLAP